MFAGSRFPRLLRAALPRHAPFPGPAAPLPSRGAASAAAGGAPVPDFNDARESFAAKSLRDLVRARAVFRLSQVRPLVANADRLVRAAYSVLGTRITNALLRWSFFGHFCAGEDVNSIRPTVQFLERNGIGSILDYAAESDLEEEDAEPPAPQSPAAAGVQCRVYDYKDEELCDAHAATFEACIRAVHDVSPTGFAAIKITALGNPLLLKRMSVALVELRKLFQRFDVDGTGHVTREQFLQAYARIFVSGDAAALFDELDVDKDGMVDYIEWSNKLVLEELHNLTSHCREKGPLSQAVLDPEERSLLARMRERADRLASLAQQLGVRLMIDAEHTYFQPAIDNITVDLARKYNRAFPAVFGTYQMYLRDSLGRLRTDIERAQKGGYWFAAKLVRGAYVALEREYAAENGLEDPIWPNIADTHANYDSGVAEVLKRMAAGEKVEVMIASHNQRSVEKAIALVRDLGMGPGNGVYFGQLLGMADNLTFPLGHAGYKAYKYVPYGKVNEVMPYLIRRAQENSDALGGAGKELKMLRTEIRRRIFPALS
ncbi:proline dehydrogenase [Hyaloraphidium curvatum]|nr:proline dehydrogenase [Hyaloraphidium curvatum]